MELGKDLHSQSDVPQLEVVELQAVAAELQAVAMVDSLEKAMDIFGHPTGRELVPLQVHASPTNTMYRHIYIHVVAKTEFSRNLDIC